MKEPNPIKALPAWEETASSHRNQACIVQEWELVSIDLDGQETHFLYGTVVSDYKRRWQYGDYVFTSSVTNFDEETGLVKTKNSLYCLVGDGEEVFATLKEAAKMRAIGQSLHTIRAIERDVGEIQGPDHD
ncbi:DUF6957 family protein [Halomonas rhizosphaerae]|uniref:DUF6957 domain-containing protein n=1 Tax=Halomonas rhizosphaerae TaxID=3043296 RepID=A0ABT6UU64_9GAMM|nr:hypothetical protein [Halomonas rhizosphaerae]MDI5889495.1 hypothetical protein [Halomonas rhizosphaerae]